jgi:parallel beta-helix repeat protein
MGVELYYCVNDIITLCNFVNNIIGVRTQGEANNTIIKNNFIKNRIHGFFLLSNITWESNYYDNWKGVGQKIIVGLLGIKVPLPFPPGNCIYLDIIPSFDYDMHPAEQPYYIG